MSVHIQLHLCKAFFLIGIDVKEIRLEYIWNTCKMSVHIQLHLCKAFFLIGIDVKEIRLEYIWNTCKMSVHIQLHFAVDRRISTKYGIQNQRLLVEGLCVVRMPIPVVVRFKAQICFRWFAGMANSYPADSMDVRVVCVCVCVCCVGNGLCDQLITRAEETNRMRVFELCVSQKPQRGCLGPIWAVVVRRH